jgi:hypothetical protein
MLECVPLGGGPRIGYRREPKSSLFGHRQATASRSSAKRARREHNEPACCLYGLVQQCHHVVTVGLAARSITELCEVGEVNRVGQPIAGGALNTRWVSL